MPNNNDNRKNNGGFLDELLEAFFTGIIEIFGEILEALVKKFFEAIFAIAAIALVIYLIVTFATNHM